MPRYEFVEGTSSKFWEITLDGEHVVTQYGRIGGTPQSTRKSFDSKEQAQKEYDKLISEKTRKGYSLVGKSGAAPAPRSAPKGAAKEKAKAAPAKPSKGDKPKPKASTPLDKAFADLVSSLKRSRGDQLASDVRDAFFGLVRVGEARRAMEIARTVRGTPLAEDLGDEHRFPEVQRVATLLGEPVPIELNEDEEPLAVVAPPPLEGELTRIAHHEMLWASSAMRPDSTLTTTAKERGRVETFVRACARILENTPASKRAALEGLRELGGKEVPSIHDSDVQALRLELEMELEGPKRFLELWRKANPPDSHLGSVPLDTFHVAKAVVVDGVLREAWPFDRSVLDDVVAAVEARAAAWKKANPRGLSKLDMGWQKMTAAASAGSESKFLEVLEEGVFAFIREGELDRAIELGRLLMARKPRDAWAPMSAFSGIAHFLKKDVPAELCLPAPEFQEWLDGAPQHRRQLIDEVREQATEAAKPKEPDEDDNDWQRFEARQEQEKAQRVLEGLRVLDSGEPGCERKAFQWLRAEMGAGRHSPLLDLLMDLAAELEDWPAFLTIGRYTHAHWYRSTEPGSCPWSSIHVARAVIGGVFKNAWTFDRTRLDAFEAAARARAGRPPPPFAWKPFLEELSAAAVDAGVAEDAREKPWLGKKPATAEEIAKLEARLGAALPPSYRAFLETSNGFGCTSDAVPAIRPAAKVKWFREENQGWIDAYQTPDVPEVTDEEHRAYGENQDPTSFDRKYLSGALQVSDTDDGVYLLNPAIKTKDGEWEAWFFANSLPGAERFPSFRELMIHMRDQL